MADYINPRAQACQSCVKAKAKCYGHTNNNGRCERCNRLNRDCVLPEPIVRSRKSRAAKRNAQAERIAQLEERLNSLTSADCISRPPSLEGNCVTPAASANTPSNSSSSASYELPERQLPLQGSGINNFSDQIVLPNSHIPASVVPEEHSFEFIHESSRTPWSPSPDELLDIFRQKLSQQASFVIVPAQMNAQALSEQKPFLYKAIIFAASYHDSVHQLALGQQFIRDITEQVVILGLHNIDLLQGLLVYVSWYKGMFYPKSQINCLLSLIFSLVVDLHLFYPNQVSQNHDEFVREVKVVCPSYHERWIRRNEPTKEEKRAILGSFCLFSTISMQFNHINPLHWTPFVQQCHDDILTSAESQNDIYLAYYSNLQRISEDVKHSCIHCFPQQPQTWNGAVAANFKLLLSELERFKASLPESLSHNDMLILNYHAVEMYLFEICFSMPPTTLRYASALQRADVLSMCLTATQAFLRHYFSINSKEYVSFCPVVSCQVYFAMMTISKFKLLEAEDWIINDSEMSLDLFTVVDQVATNMEKASVKYDRSADNKPWFRVSQKIREIGVQFEGFLARKNRSIASRLQIKEADGSSIIGSNISFDQFDLLDDEFWQSLSENTHSI